MVIAVSIIVLILIVLGYVYSPWKRPLATESDYTHHRTPWWQLYYASKYLCPVKRPARRSALERVFSKDMGPSPDNPKISNIEKVTINCIGDLMVRRDIVGEGGRELWDLVGKEVFSGDLNFANLEFSVNPDLLIEKLLRYSVPEAFALPLLGDKRFGRFDLLFCANNHINDGLSAGINSTLDFLDREKILHAGASRTREEQDQFPIIDYKGIRIAVLSYTFSTNAIPLDRGMEFGTNVVRFNALNDSDYDPSIIYRHIELAKKQQADFIIASNHWGLEFEYYPPPRIVKRAHELLNAGIDLIVGHHPHILNPVERYTTNDGREGMVLYSLGNLTSVGLKFPLTRMCELAKVELEIGIDNSGKKVVQIGQLSLMPILHSMHKKGSVVNHRLLPILKLAQELKHGKKPGFLSNRDKYEILKVEKEFRTFFQQHGINYL